MHLAIQRFIQQRHMHPIYSTHQPCRLTIKYQVSANRVS